MTRFPQRFDPLTNRWYINDPDKPYANAAKEILVQRLYRILEASGVLYDEFIEGAVISPVIPQWWMKAACYALEERGLAYYDDWVCGWRLTPPRS